MKVNNLPDSTLSNFLSSLILLFCFIFPPREGKAKITFKDQAQNQKTNPFLFFNTNKKVKFSYFSKDWNENHLRKDKALLFLKLINSKKLLLIELQETNPSSSIFRGEFYMTLKEDKNEDLSSSKIKEIKRKKFLIKSKILNKNSSFFQIYLIPKKSQSLYKKNHNTLKLIPYAKKILKNKTYPHLYVLNASAKNHEFHIFDTKSSMEKHEEKLIPQRRVTSLPLRVFIENQKLNFLEKEIQSLNSKEGSQKREKEEKKSKEKAFLFYKKKNFLEAEKFFKKTHNFNPRNKNSSFNYAISLYRNKKFKEALTQLYLSKAKKGSRKEIEIHYFKALIYYQMNKTKKAQSIFKRIRKLNHLEFSPISGFYEGLILYSRGQLKKSLEAFERTLSQIKNSENKSHERLKRTAQAYKEEVQEILNHQKEEKKSFSLYMSTGTLYNSNALLETHTQNLNFKEKTNTSAGVKWLLSGDGFWKFYKNKKYELQMRAHSFYLYSLKKSHSFLDPFLLLISSSFFYNLNQKKIKSFEISPVFETFFMDFNQDGKRENLIKSLGLKNNISIAHGKKWQANYEIFFSSDLNKNEQIFKKTTNNFQYQDTKALRIGVQTNQMIFLKNNLKNTASLQLKALHSNSEENSKDYFQVEGTLNKGFFIKNWFYLNTGIRFYSLIFLNKDFLPNVEMNKKRKDLYFNIYTDLKIPLNQSLDLGLWGGYSNNQSSIDHYKYRNLSFLMSLNLKI